MSKRDVCSIRGERCRGDDRADKVIGLQLRSVGIMNHASSYLVNWTIRMRLMPKSFAR